MACCVPSVPFISGMFWSNNTRLKRRCCLVTSSTASVPSRAVVIAKRVERRRNRSSSFRHIWMTVGGDRRTWRQGQPVLRGGS